MTSGISDQTSPDSIKIGGWLFRHRTALPVPVSLALLLIPAPGGPGGWSGPSGWTPVVAGVVLTLGGELIRLASVHHIGAISRTRSERLGPLIDTGPFAIIRNPLYVGNILIWVGFTLTARLLWLVPIVFALLALEYHAIVKWEESLLESRIGAAYRDYTTRVPRWIPRRGGRKQSKERDEKVFSWRETFFSERGTLIALAAGYFLLWLKARF